MSRRKKPPNTTGSPCKPSEDGTKKENSTAAELKATSEDSALKENTRSKSPLSVMQESLPIPKGMTSKDKLNFYVQNTQTQKLFEKLEADSVLNGENSSVYWNEYAKEISQNLSSLMPIEPCDLDYPSSNGSASKMELNSWFSTKEIYLQKPNSLKISCPSSTVSVQGFTDCENTKSKPKKQYKIISRNQTKKLTPNSVRKLRVYPSKELHQIWKRWVNAYRWIYNWTIAVLREGCQKRTYDLQKMARESERPDWVKTLPGHQLQEAVADAVDDNIQALANRGFPKFKSCRQPSQVVKFKAGNFKKGQWYPTKVKGINYRTPEGFPPECEYGTQLVWERGAWYGVFPEVRREIPTEQSKVIALDPGVRTFMTGYDGERIVEFGSSDIGRIQRLCSHLDRLISRIDLSANKQQRRAMRKAARRLRKKIRNLVKDTHNKISRFLVSHYKMVFLPTFDTSEMVVKSGRKLSKKTARNMLSWSHYKFKQNLCQMAKRENVLVVFCNESYTSKTCPECGHLHETLGGKKKFRCPKCGYSAPRDWNGARNIMIRALQATAISFTDDAIRVLG
jgi:putative transposase